MNYRYISILFLVYFFVFSWASIGSYRSFKSDFDDLGNLSTTIWGATQGDWGLNNYNGNTENSTDPRGQATSRLSLHSNLIFYLVAPLYWIFPYNETLLILVSLACALTGIALFLISAHYFQSNYLSLIPPLVFWLSPFTQDANLYDFHVINLATCFLSWSFYFFLNQKDKWAYLMILLTILCKEDMVFVVFCYAFYFLWKKEFRRSGILLGLSLIGFILIHKVLMPSYNTNSILLRRYGDMGKDASSVIAYSVKNPLFVLEKFTHWQYLRLPLAFLILGGALAYRSWPLLLMLLPHLAMGFLSKTSWTNRLTGTYYWVLCEWVIILAVVVGLSKLSKKWIRRGLAYLLLITLLHSLAFSPLPYSKRGRLSDYKMMSLEEKKSLEHIEKAILKSNSFVSAQSNIASFFSNRWVINDNTNSEYSEFKIYYLKYVRHYDKCNSVKSHPDHLLEKTPPELFNEVKGYLNNEKWGLVYESNSFFVFQKNAPAQISPEKSQESIRYWESLYQNELRNHNQRFIDNEKFLIATCSWVS